MKILPSSLLAVSVLAISGILIAAPISSAAVLTIASTLNTGTGTQVNGLAFRVEGGARTVYAADSANSNFRAFDLTSGLSTLNINTGTYTYAAAVGIGDNNPEYYVSAADGRTLRYNNVSFVTTFYAPVVIAGVESANPYLGYTNFWAVESGTSNLLLLDYETVQTALQTITTIGTGLTDVAVGLNGSIYALGGNSIYEYTTGGSYVTTYGIDSAIVNPTGIAYDTTTGQFLISNNTNNIYTLSAVPEPSTLVLAVLAVGGVLGLRRRFLLVR